MDINILEEFFNTDLETRFMYLIRALLEKGIIKPEDLMGIIQYDIEGNEVFEGNNPEKVMSRKEELKAITRK